MPRWFEYLFNTPSHHRVHHAVESALSRPQLCRRAHGVGPDVRHASPRSATEEPPRYGIVKNIDTFNPIRIAFHEWLAIGRDLDRRALVARGARAWCSGRRAGAPTAAASPRRTSASEWSVRQHGRLNPSSPACPATRSTACGSRDSRRAAWCIGNSIQSMGFLGGVRSAFRGDRRRRDSGRDRR